MPTSPHAAPETGESPFQLGPWRIEPETGELSGEDQTLTLEPQLMALLSLLAAKPGRVMSRAAIEQALWSDVVVGEDTVARAISRLRRALGDDAKSQRYIETLPKRGYRLIQPVTRTDDPASGATTLPATSGYLRPGVIVASGLSMVLAAFFWHNNTTIAPSASDPLAQEVARANDLYMRFTRADNEAAIGLYERVLSEAPDNANAQAGLANALVQRVVRWPRNDALIGATTLTEALDRGLTRDADAQVVLERAAAMAERAVRLAPQDPDAIKAVAFVYTAQGHLDRAQTLYQEVLNLDSDAWAALINLGEIASMRNEVRSAVDYFERAWAAMSRAYAYEPQRVGPWQVALGVVIGETHEKLHQPADAELWYRRVLAEAPFEPEATVRLAKLLAARGDGAAAQTLCRDLVARLGAYAGCDVAQ